MARGSLLRDLVYAAVVAVLAWHTGERVVKCIRTYRDSAALAGALIAPITISHCPLVEKPASLLVAADGRPLPPAATGRTLILVMGRTTFRSVEAAAAWRSMLRRLPATADLTVWSVVIEETDLSRSIFESTTLPIGRTRLLRIRSAKEFVDAAGLSGVPATLLFHGSTLQAMTMGAVPDTAAAELLALIGDAERPAPSNPLLSDSAPDWLELPQPDSGR